MALELKSSAFGDGTQIPRKYTEDGQDVSPPLAWTDPPEGTSEWALVCDDPDAPSQQPWVHWVIYRLAADIRSLPEGIPNEPAITKPVVALQGKNSWPSGVRIGYRGPAPPPGHGTHHYHFKLYALDSQLNLASSATKEQLLSVIEGHVLAQAELIGTYRR